MSPARTVFALLALTTLLACEPVLEPEVSVDVSSSALAGGGGVVESVAGSGQYQRTADLFTTFSVQAQKRADGTVSGTWQIDLHNVAKGRGTIDCFTIVGNRAYLSGTWLSPAFLAGSRAIMEVVDNGEGENGAAPDEVSTIANTTANFARKFCNGNFPSIFHPLRDVEKGNIQIRPIG